MRIEDQVEKQLQEEYNKFNYAPYIGKGDVPSNLLELFRVGYMSMPAQFHKIQSIRVQAILEKDIPELTPSDINEVIKIVANTAPERFFDNIDEALEFQARLDKFLLLFNDAIKSFSEGLQMKRKTLMDLSGLNGGALPRIGR